MKSVSVNGHQVQFCPFDSSYTDQLLIYFGALSPDTKKRFGPHPFIQNEIISRYQTPEQFRLFIGIENDLIVAYTILKNGWVDFDIPRLTKYGLTQKLYDWTIAPSVADERQNLGLGSAFFSYLIGWLKSEENISRLFLWGGVQSRNHRAVHIYRKFGFKTLGEFEHNGNNVDMMLTF